jgi:hypothetical protein
MYNLGFETLLLMRNPWGHNQYKGAWTKNSGKWNEDIKAQVNFDALHNDSGLFYMSWNEYLSAFRRTTICMEANPQKYCHSGQTMLDFNTEELPHVFLRFTLK